MKPPMILLLALLGLALLPEPLLAAPISEVLFEGNTVTRDTVLRQELLLSEGDEVDLKRVEASRQAIMNLGLFKSVNSRLEEDGNARRLIFTVEERFFLLPIPLLNGDLNEANYSYGFELRHDNVMGLNQRLKLSIENEESLDTAEPSKRELALKYSIPRLVGTPFQLAVDAKRITQKVIERDDSGALVTGSYQQEANSGGFFLSRWVEQKWISQGWTVGAGLSVEERKYHQQVGSAIAYRNSQSIAITSGLSYNHVAEHLYHRSGTYYGYTLSVAQPALASDYDFTRHWLFYRGYLPLATLDANINSQFRLGLANGRAFARPTYSIGNSTLLRGYENGYAEGDAVLLLNLEYHQHFTGYRQLRGVLFTDVGNAWESPMDMHLRELPASLGVGLRWRVQSFVDLTLRMDYAHALQYDNNIITLTTSASF